ncbi:MAG: HAD family hydrolase [Spirochaetales bacterium]|nr:HAD family hydrolase [Spirochaetales bacterium]
MKVVFDIDNTLIDYYGAEREGARKFGKMFAAQIPGYNRDRFCERWAELTQREFERFLAREISYEDQRLNRIRLIFDNPHMTDEEAWEYFSHYYNFYEQSWELYDDVLECLGQLKARGIEMAVITDGAQIHQEKKLVNMGIREYFQFVLTAEGEGMVKPEAEFFLRAVNRFGSEPGDVIYVGDNLTKDARGASGAGLIGVWLNRNGEEGDWERTIDSLEGMSSFFSS